MQKSRKTHRPKRSQKRSFAGHLAAASGIKRLGCPGILSENTATGRAIQDLCSAPRPRQVTAFGQGGHMFVDPVGRILAMGWLSGIFAHWFGEDERAEATKTWHRFLRRSLMSHRGALQGQRIVVKNQRLAGPREIALIIEVGLEDLGATVVRDGPFDWEVHITKYSGDQALYTILDSQGNEITSGTVHPEQTASRTIRTLAEHIASRTA